MFTPREEYPDRRTNAPGVSFDDKDVTPHRLKDLPMVGHGRVPVIDLGDLLCGPAGNRSGLRRIGDKWVGRCPLPDCTAKLFSFAIWPCSDSWHCFSCLRSGGVTDLARLAGHALVGRREDGDPRD
jgi:hypothetical protein